MPDKRTQTPAHSPSENHLLAALPAMEYERIRPHLELVALHAGQVLYESGAQLRYLYFPVSGVVSMLHVMADGSTGEIAVLGNDGCVGISILLGGGSTPNRKVVQIEGHAYRIRADVLMREFRRGGALHDLLLRYAQGFMTQISQTAVCNRHHPVEQQLCRWLLLTLDRVPEKEVHMTQELISNMLGVRRSGITVAANKLQELGLIENRRGLITVVDRAKLEAHACECYSVVKKEMDRLGLLSLPQPRAANS
jgi:CRP-like cAMP-binding protein